MFLILLNTRLAWKYMFVCFLIAWRHAKSWGHDFCTCRVIGWWKYWQWYTTFCATAPLQWVQLEQAIFSLEMIVQLASISDRSQFALRNCSRSFRSISDWSQFVLERSHSDRFWLRSISDRSNHRRHSHWWVRSIWDRSKSKGDLKCELRSQMRTEIDPRSI